MQVAYRANGGGSLNVLFNSLYGTNNSFRKKEGKRAYYKVLPVFQYFNAEDFNAIWKFL